MSEINGTQSTDAPIGLSRREWRELARQGSWQMTRMNLNTFPRHGLFAD